MCMMSHDHSYHTIEGQGQGLSSKRGRWDLDPRSGTLLWLSKVRRGPDNACGRSRHSVSAVSCGRPAADWSGAAALACVLLYIPRLSDRDSQSDAVYNSMCDRCTATADRRRTRNAAAAAAFRAAVTAAIQRRRRRLTPATVARRHCRRRGRRGRRGAARERASWNDADRSLDGGWWL